MELIELFANQDAAGVGTGKYWPGGDGLLLLEGTMGGSTFTLQFSPRGDLAPNYKPLDASMSFTAAGATNFTLPAGWIRGVLTGGAPVDIYATAQRIVQP